MNERHPVQERSLVLPLAVDNTFIEDVVSAVVLSAESLRGNVGFHASRLITEVRATDLTVTVPADRYVTLIEKLAEEELVRMAVHDTPGIDQHVPAEFMAAIAKAQADADARFDADIEAERAARGETPTL